MFVVDYSFEKLHFEEKQINEAVIGRTWGLGMFVA